MIGSRFGFVDADYYHKSIATQIYHDAEWAQILYTGSKCFPHGHQTSTALSPMNPKNHTLNCKTMGPGVLWKIYIHYLHIIHIFTYFWSRNFIIMSNLFTADESQSAGLKLQFLLSSRDSLCSTIFYRHESGRCCSFLLYLATFCYSGVIIVEKTIKICIKIPINVLQFINPLPGHEG